MGTWVRLSGWSGVASAGPVRRFMRQRNGYFHILEYVRANPHARVNDFDDVCEAGARGGQLAVLQRAWSNDFDWDRHVCSSAALEGHLEVLKWARCHGCPWDE